VPVGTKTPLIIVRLKRYHAEKIPRDVKRIKTYDGIISKKDLIS
jgi:hypothetical protein